MVTAISRHRDGPAGTADLLTLTPTGEGDGGHGRVAPSDGTGDVSGGPLVQRFPAIARDHRGGGGGVWPQREQATSVLRLQSKGLR